MTVEELLDRERRLVDAALERMLPADTCWPARLHRAMRYAVLGGGKRVRPILARRAHAAAGGEPDLITEAVWEALGGEASGLQAERLTRTISGVTLTYYRIQI